MVELGGTACTGGYESTISVNRLIDGRADHPREGIHGMQGSSLRLGKEKRCEIKRSGVASANLTRRPKPQLICLNRSVSEAGRLCHVPIMRRAVDFSIRSANLCQRVTRAYSRRAGGGMMLRVSARDANSHNARAVHGLYYVAPKGA